MTLPNTDGGGAAPSFDAGRFRKTTRQLALARLVEFRLAVAPVLSCFALTFAVVESAVWRRITLAVVVPLLLVVSVVEFVRVRRLGQSAAALPLNLLFMAAAQLAIVAVSGGLFSPILVGVVITSVMVGLLAEPDFGLKLGFLLQLPTFWALAYVHGAYPDVLVPDIIGGVGELERGWLPTVAATVLSAFVFAALGLGNGIRHIVEDLVRGIYEDKSKALALYAEQSRTLTTLSGEIAHELKNPLASIQGLAALLARNLTGRDGERLAVLRREAGRMSAIVDEFLNFSRPLVPLVQEDVDLLSLLQDVADLHEGMAAARDQRIAVRSESGAERLRCDPRKVRQVLVNLLQNALEASPRGQTVECVLRRSEASMVLSVYDRGPGLDAARVDRIFEPGVTGKEMGSGLGLPVARSLARQHGGDLHLEDRPGGGAEARLVLPCPRG